MLTYRDLEEARDDIADIDFRLYDSLCAINEELAGLVSDGLGQAVWNLEEMMAQMDEEEEDF